MILTSSALWRTLRQRALLSYFLSWSWRVLPTAFLSPPLRNLCHKPWARQPRFTSTVGPLRCLKKGPFYWEVFKKGLHGLHLNRPQEEQKVGNPQTKLITPTNDQATHDEQLSRNLLAQLLPLKAGCFRVKLHFLHVHPEAREALSHWLPCMLRAGHGRTRAGAKKPWRKNALWPHVFTEVRWETWKTKPNNAQTAPTWKALIRNRPSGGNR